MNSDTVENPVKVVLDTNILISGLGFKGKPRQILHLLFQKRVLGVTSPVLLAEFQEVVNKKFPQLALRLASIEKKLKRTLQVVQPKVSIKVSRDEDDNRVLEAAWEGNCDYIVTGDSDLLDLKNYKKIKILTAEEFLLQPQP